MTRRPIFILVLLGASQAGCDSDVHEKAEPRTPMPAGITGVYAGDFRCSNCEKIEATLWLRDDGRFFLRQRFVGDAESSTVKTPQPPAPIYGLGRWDWDEIAAEIVLHGAGPERRLVVSDTDHLELRAAAAAHQVLARDRSEPEFKDRMTLDGESVMTQNGATFKECLTGLVLPVVVDAGQYRQLRHHHRTMNGSGKVALTILEGHLVTAGAGATTSERLVVDQFISLKPGTGC
jgi:NlpE C-terminal OB domain/NlpE N-terminal domain